MGSQCRQNFIVHQADDIAARFDFHNFGKLLQIRDDFSVFCSMPFEMRLIQALHFRQPHQVFLVVEMLVDVEEYLPDFTFDLFGAIQLFAFTTLAIGTVKSGISVVAKGDQLNNTLPYRLGLEM